MLALTATADENTKATIISKLLLKDPTSIKISPNRRNLRLSVKKIKKDYFLEELDWLVDKIQTEADKTEKIIIFCSMMTDIASVVNYLMLKLGKSAYSPKGSDNPNDCLLGIYHSSSWQKSKDRVLDSLKGEGKVRIAVASTALSMGVNFPNIRYIINWGPPRNILDFHQQAGRAGRDNLPGHVITIYHGQQLSHCEEAVKDIVKSVNTSCLRVAAYVKLDTDIETLLPGHECCTFCSKECSCQGEGQCEYRTYEFENERRQEEIGHHLSRAVLESDKKDLREALTEIQQDMSQSLLLGDAISMHGFSSQLIDDVVKNCSTLFTVDDVFNTCPVFSLSHATKILGLIQDIFQDIPNFDETMNMIESGDECVGQMYYLQQVLQDISHDIGYWR